MLAQTTPTILVTEMQLSVEAIKELIRSKIESDNEDFPTVVELDHCDENAYNLQDAVSSFTPSDLFEYTMYINSREIKVVIDVKLPNK
jgi:hypothetical protein